MEQIEFQIPVGATVKLKEVSAEFYGGYACYGNVGTIKDHRLARFGYPEVLVEWDKDHWAYNGAPDGWTFESHFDLVEAPMAENNEQLQKNIETIALDFARTVASAIAGRETEPDTAGEKQTEDQGEAYGATLRDALPVLLDSTAVIIFALKRAPDGGYLPFLIREARTPLAEEILNIQLAHLVAHNYETLVKESLEIGDDGGKE
jgi:hypothetical protein